MTLHELLVAPFVDFGFMRRALVAAFALSLGAGPIGVLLVLRRMSLMGDAMAHAILPGAALGYVFAGLSLPAMTLGGFAAGLATAALAGWVARVTALREDASFAAFYLVSLALGVMIVSTQGGQADLMRVLFGTVLAVDDVGLLVMAGVATLTLLTLGAIYRPLVIESFDPGFLRSVGGAGASHHFAVTVLVVLNLVAAFQVLGTLMAVGILILPAAAAKFWARTLWSLAVCASGFAFGSSVLGLLVSYHADWPSGPTVVLGAGAAYLGSVFFGTNGSLRAQRAAAAHLRG
jgi:zinc/manganese transport system permease protein